jgi:hypothetical protein
MDTISGQDVIGITRACGLAHRRPGMAGRTMYLARGELKCRQPKQFRCGIA